jgi:predicted RNase H-like nuclease (RuvC/YqgF family)
MSKTTPDAPLSQGLAKELHHIASVYHVVDGRYTESGHKVIEAARLIAENAKLASQLAAYKTKGLDTAVRKQKLEELEAERDKLKEEVEVWKRSTYAAETSRQSFEELHDKLVERVSVLERLLRQARNQVVGFMLDTHTPEQATANVAYIDAALTRPGA